MQDFAVEWGSEDRKGSYAEYSPYFLSGGLMEARSYRCGRKFKRIRKKVGKKLCTMRNERRMKAKIINYS